MRKISNKTLISSNGFKVEDWKLIRAKLLDDIEKKEISKALWKQAYLIFKERVTTRYLIPIDRIIAEGTSQGEGFSAAAIQCILIEFFESFYEGKIYRPTNESVRPNEYKSSSKLFINFLRTHLPFKNYFTNRNLADGFYRNIRCGLLHEAATKELSLIKSKHRTKLIEKIDKYNMIYYRNNFQTALKEYLEHYKEELLSNKKLQINFIRKMDDLAGMRNIYYFAYGSNMDKVDLDKWCKEKGYPRIHIFSIEPAELDGYKLVFNYYSKSRNSGAANIIQFPGDSVYGLLIEIDENDFNTIKHKEGAPHIYGEISIDVKILNNANIVKDVKTFIVTKKYQTKENQPPIENYLGLIIKNAKEFQFPDDYIEYLYSIPIKRNDLD